MQAKVLWQDQSAWSPITGNIKTESKVRWQIADSSRFGQRTWRPKHTWGDQEVEKRDNVLSTSGISGKARYWDGKFVATNIILLLIAAIAAYLEYSVYPAIMTQSFGETGLSLQLSALIFRWNAISCIYGSCKQILGVQALDFFQIFVLAIIFVNLSHYFGQRKKR